MRLQGPQNEQRAPTDLKGLARFRGLVPGEYTVIAEIAGFRGVRREGLVVTVGRSTQVDLQMGVAGIEELVLVTGASPLIDARSVGVGATIESELVNLTPSGAGLLSSVLDKVPGVAFRGSDVGGANSVTQQLPIAAHGSLRGQSQFNLNGTQTIDFRTRSAIPGMFYSVPSFAEVEVSTAAHDIEYQSPGVIINMVSKSGSNRLRGAFRFNYSNESLAGDNVSDELIEQGVKKGNPDTLLAELDVQVGGPLVRDKLWGFVDYWHFDKERLIIGVPEDERDERSLRNVTVNLDWQIAGNQRLALRYFYSGKFTLNAFAGPQRDPSAAGLSDFDNHLVQANWLGTWGDNTYSDLRASFKPGVSGSTGRGPDSAAPHPDYPAGVPLGYDFFTGAWSGMPGEHRGWTRDLQLHGSVAHYVPGNRFAHDLKLGGQYIETRDWRVNILALGVVQWFAGGAPDSVDLYTNPKGTLDSVGREYGTAKAGRFFGLYLQDSIAIGQRWNVSAGLRYDHSNVWLPEQTGVDSWWAGIIPDEENGAEFFGKRFPEKQVNDWGDLVPRISVTYDASGRGKTLLKGSYGQYSMQQLTSLAGEFNPNGNGSNTYLWDDLNGDGIFQWGEQGTRISRYFPTVNSELDPDLKSSRSHELTFGVEHQAWRDLVVGATVIYRNVTNVIEDIDIGVPYDSYAPVTVIDPGPDGVLGTPDDGGPITVWNQDPGTLGQSLFLITNPAKWGFDVPYDYRALELVVRKRFSDRWQMLASWTLGRTDSSLGGLGSSVPGVTYTPTFDNPNADINRFGRIGLPHIVKVNGSYLFADPVGVNLAVSLRHQSSPAVSRNFRTERGLLNQGRVRIIAAPKGKDDNPASLGGRLDAITILDLRAEKQVRLPGRWGRVGVSLDVFNLLNENATRGAVTSAGPAYGRIRSIVPPRMLRLGVNWIF